MSGLPLKVSVRFQINMAMRDVSNMAHVDKFSNITIPMLWFEIVNIYFFFKLNIIFLLIYKSFVSRQ